MNYENAGKIGSILDGYIKCTCAVLMVADENTHIRTFSFQNRHTFLNSAYEELNEALSGGVGEETENDINMAYQMAIVQAESDRLFRIGKSFFVPVQLTDFALDLISKKIVSRPQTYVTKVIVTLHVKKHHTDALPYRKFGDYKYFDKYGHYLPGATEYHTKGKLVKEVNIDPETRDPWDWYKTVFNQRKVDWGEYSFKLERGYLYNEGKTKLLDCKANDIAWGEMAKKRKEVKEQYSGAGKFIMKECALDWVPVNIKNVEVPDPIVKGEDIDISVALEVSRKKLDRAKAILITAGATNII